MEEEWREVIGYPAYQVSNLGQVRSVDRESGGRPGRVCSRKGRILKSRIHKRQGYPYCSLSTPGKVITKHIHRLVAEAFIPNPEGKPLIDHIDRNRANNVVSNLRWVNHSQNQQNRAENTLDEMYIRQVFRVSGTKDGAAIKKEFLLLDEALAYRKQIWGL